MIGEALVALSLAGKAPPPPGRFLAVDAHRHRVTITLIASYNGSNGGFNFDGYGRGELLVSVPTGWRVRIRCENRGPLRHSCAVVRAGSTRPAFRGAATPQPFRGLDPGQTSRFTFRAGTAGVYRFACLVPGHETARMWDVFKVVRRGKPSVTDLQAR